MSRGRARPLLLAALVAAFVLRHDLWWWDDPRRVLGLPIGLTYHVGICLAVAAVLGLLVRHGWPGQRASGGGA